MYICRRSTVKLEISSCSYCNIHIIEQRKECFISQNRRNLRLLYVVVVNFKFFLFNTCKKNPLCFNIIIVLALVEVEC